MLPLIAGNWKMHGMALQLGEIEAVAASVKSTPPSILALPQVGGVLVGGASLEAADFDAIVKAASVSAVSDKE
jgi:triosephosphate isomerase